MSEDCRDIPLSFNPGPEFEKRIENGTSFYIYRYPYVRNIIGLYNIPNVPDYGYAIVTVPSVGDCYSYVYDAQGNEIECHKW